MTVSPVDAADDHALREWFDVRVAAHAVDHPSFPSAPWPEVWHDHQAAPAGSRWFLSVARDADGAAMGCARLQLREMENVDVGWVDLHVAPQARRRGVGTALLTALGRVARDGGATRLIGTATEPITGPAGSSGEAFAAARGARKVIDEVHRLLDLIDASSQRAAWDRLLGDAWRRAAGYRLVQWVGDTPDDVKAGWAHLRGRMNVEVPLEDLVLGAEEWDADRVTRLDDANRARGRVRIATAAIHEASGRMVGYSDIGQSVHATDTAHQWETIVLKEHRGHRLGLLLKLANLNLLRGHSPRTRYVHTFNATVNSHMVAINDLVGFRPVERCSSWELDLR